MQRPAPRRRIQRKALSIESQSIRLNRFASAGTMYLACTVRKPQRKFDAGRLRKQFQQLVRFMTVVEKLYSRTSNFGPDDRFIDFGVGSAMIVSVEKPPIDLFDAYDTIVTPRTLVLLFITTEVLSRTTLSLSYFTHFGIREIHPIVPEIWSVSPIGNNVTVTGEGPP